MWDVALHMGRRNDVGAEIGAQSKSVLCSNRQQITTCARRPTSRLCSKTHQRPTMAAYIDAISARLANLGSAAQRRATTTLDRIIPPKQRAEMWSHAASFADRHPLLAVSHSASVQEARAALTLDEYSCCWPRTSPRLYHHSFSSPSSAPRSSSRSWRSQSCLR